MTELEKLTTKVEKALKKMDKDYNDTRVKSLTDDSHNEELNFLDGYNSALCDFLDNLKGKRKGFDF